VTDHEHITFGGQIKCVWMVWYARVYGRSMVTELLGGWADGSCWATRLWHMPSPV